MSRPIHGRAPAALLALILVAACGGGGDADLPDAGSGDAADNPNRVSGRFLIRTVAESTVRTLPIDLSNTTFEAIMPDGQRIAGEGDFTGNFEILDVPEGPYILRIGPRYVVTERRQFDLSLSILGREDVARIDEHTPMTLTLTDLNPWADGDTIEMFSPNGGFSFLDALTTSDPDPGSTIYIGSIDPFLAQSAGEVDSDKGDTLYVTQVGSRLVNGSEIREVLAGGVVDTGVLIESGEPGTIDATLFPPALSSSVDIEWNASAYTAVMEAMGPSLPQSMTTRVRLVTTPTDPVDGVIAAFPTLASAVITGTGTIDLSANFGNPYPMHWDQLEIDELSAQIELAPGSGVVTVRAGAASFPGRISSDSTPVLGPASGVTIGGFDAAVTIESAGTTPVVEWVAPSVGGADAYEIDVIEIDPGQEFLGTFYTVDTSITIPEGLLETGSTYYLIIRSLSAPAIDLGANPFDKTVPSAFAEFATAPFSP